MDIREKIKTIIEDALSAFGVPKDMLAVNLDIPINQKFGDYSTNVAMTLAKSMGATTKNPLDLAHKITEKINEALSKIKNSDIEKVEVAAPGFINFFLSNEFFIETVNDVLEKNIWYGKNTKLWNKKIIIEYTDPNAFKQFHIGHLMSNAIGESLSRILDFHDAKVTRANYTSDVGMNIAKGMWGILKHEQDIPYKSSLAEQVSFIGKSYVLGAQAFEHDVQAAEEIVKLNNRIYEKSDDHINEIYQWGRRVSLEHFEEIYKKLGTKFNYYIFESEVAEEGKNIVLAYLSKGVFRESNGAIIFPGEEHGLHNRVFINSQGWPTYEAKELGLAKKKFQIHDFDQSITITGNEQNDYFKVVLKTIEVIYPEIARRMIHIGHGLMLMRGQEDTSASKMSSRKGNAVTGESLVADIEARVHDVIKDREFSDTERIDVAERISIAAIKFSILKQSIGKDIIFDPEKSLSFEGDSGPYIQYTYVRAKSILKKAEEAGISKKVKASVDVETTRVEKLLHTFPLVVERARLDLAPNYIATHLLDLASEFNAYYAKTKIINPDDDASSYRVALTEAVSWVLKNGLWLLGIEVPERM
jgi:arginyl-tRNA synthetase